MARGFKNSVYFRTAAYHRAGKLKLAVPTINELRNSESALFSPPR
jgi:hypothetical protein